MEPTGVRSLLLIRPDRHHARRWSLSVPDRSSIHPLGCVAGHPGIAYHFKDIKNWEGFYFRPHSTNSKSAIQFTCTVNGKATYPAGNKVNVPTDGSWFTATVKVSATQATLKLDGLTWTVNRCAKNVAGGVGVIK